MNSGMRILTRLQSLRERSTRELSLESLTLLRKLLLLNQVKTATSIKSVSEINESAEENFFDTFMSTTDEDEMLFGDKKIQAPVGA